jgi:outer membrane PBP1 activator LpoA protein
MPQDPSSISDLAATVKSREVQRAMLAEMAGDRSAARRHFLAAAHLELVLAEDYSQAGADDLSLRSKLSAASCLWRAGQIAQAQELLATLAQSHPSERNNIQEVLLDLTREFPAQAS